MPFLLQASNIIPEANYHFSCSPLSLNISTSSIISIIGPESSGKNIWLKTLTGFNPLAQGELSILNNDVRKLNRKKWLKLQNRISYIGNDCALLSAYTLIENILLPALYHKQNNRKELTHQAHQLLKEIGVDNLNDLNELPSFASPLLSYYTKIVRALIVRPQLLYIADLYSDISPGRCYNLKHFLHHKVKQTNLTVISTTSHINQVIDDSSEFIFISKSSANVYKNKQALLSSQDRSITNYLIQNNIH